MKYQSQLKRWHHETSNVRSFAFSQSVNNPRERGVALVITLIMLSVITFLTVAFLAVSRRDRASVTTSLNQTDARFMADTALARLQTEVTAQMMANGTLQSYDAMLTRNYINPDGFDSSIIGVNTTNVNYDYYSGTLISPLNPDDRAKNIANLFYDPRPPVFVQTNSNRNLPRDFRFYLDYNRNARFETNGLLPVVIDELGNTNGVADFFGEPEWIGVLQNPEFPHSATNRFIGRYLYLALPIGKTLDWNHIHNYAKGNVSSLPTIMDQRDGFFRNQGFGSWEINLGGFLRDLNTNTYEFNLPPARHYEYVTDPAFPNTGDAFDDALAFVRYRYDANHTRPNLFSVLDFFGTKGTNFQTDRIDGYSTRPIFTPPFANTTDPDFTLVQQDRPWAGSGNPNKFYEPQELFDTTKTSSLFVERLTNSVARTNSYDRYTFSRLLEQIGTGSEPEVAGKININYANPNNLDSQDARYRSVNTNFVEWTPVQFFTNVAQRLIKDNLTSIVYNGVTNWYLFYNGNTNYNRVNANFALTNIQIYPTNEYSAPLHRLLQVAANVYDATTTNQFPSAFRPQFKTVGGRNYIGGYADASRVVTTSASPADNFLTSTWTNRSAPNLGSDYNIYGIPVVIGAKKNLPSFNKFVMQTAVEISRVLQVIKANTNASPPLPQILATNQMLSLGISNVFAVEAWNSYLATFNLGLELRVTNQFSVVLTNDSGLVVWPFDRNPYVTNFPSPPLFLQGTPGWVGASRNPTILSNSFQVPFARSFLFLSNLTYQAALESFAKTTNFESSSNPNVGFKLPNWHLVMTNRLTYALIATNENRLIDFVSFDNLSTNISIGRELAELASGPAPVRFPRVASMWRTNRLNDATSIAIPTIGMQNQIHASAGILKMEDDEWTDFNKVLGQTRAKADAITNFATFMGYPVNGVFQKMPPTTTNETPFNPVVKMYQSVSWEINDPLVHYMPQDLLTPPQEGDQRVEILSFKDPVPPLELRRINKRYRPWGREKGGQGSGPLEGGSSRDADYAYDFRVKDPRVRWSDDWNFPTNKFPNIGWLGRVHRGTPWQTIYLKSGAITNRLGYDDRRAMGIIGNNWNDWAGHMESHPTNDWKLMDVFTVAANDNAARGVLSVNQTNQAAWSAVLSGVIVLSNSLNNGNVKGQDAALAPATFTSTVIQPGNAISNIVRQINEYRATRPNGIFTSMGEFLGAPGLSVGLTNGVVDSSPFLNVANYLTDASGNKIIEADLNKNQRFYGVSDEAYERIPQQIMSLLKLGEPRYVVYSYGQSLKPAPNSLVMTKDLRNLCTNYQITGEMVTRTIMRVEGTPQDPKTVIESYNVLSE